jgi:hypothetical protein
MMDIKEELKNFEAHCLQTGQLQVAELQRNSINKINELEAIIRGRDELINNAESSRIAELEKELQNANEDKLAVISTERKRWARADLLAIKIGDLKQQAKGLTDLAESIKENLPFVDVCRGEMVDQIRMLESRAEKLMSKAKALKDQG